MERKDTQVRIDLANAYILACVRVCACLSVCANVCVRKRPAVLLSVLCEQWLLQPLIS